MGLPISWAMPEVRRPTVANFSARINIVLSLFSVQLVAFQRADGFFQEPACRRKYDATFCSGRKRARKTHCLLFEQKKQRVLHPDRFLRTFSQSFQGPEIDPGELLIAEKGKQKAVNNHENKSDFLYPDENPDKYLSGDFRSRRQRWLCLLP
jgi:hypothetical protein